LGKLLAVVLKNTLSTVGLLEAVPNPLLSTVGFVEEVCWFVLLTSVSRKIERRRQYAQWILGLPILLFAVDL